MPDEQSERIVPLAEAGELEPAGGQPDVRRWEVVGADGRRIGRVDDLLVDTAAMKVRYLEVGLDRDELDLASERSVLLPIGYARLEREARRVRVEELTSAELAALPGFQGGRPTRAYETELRQRFERGHEAGTSDAEFYEHPCYDSSRFFGG